MEQLHQTAKNLTNLIALRALHIMAKRANAKPEDILAVINGDTNGATASYFRDLMHIGIQAAQDQHLIDVLAA